MKRFVTVLLAAGVRAAAPPAEPKKLQHPAMPEYKGEGDDDALKKNLDVIADVLRFKGDQDCGATEGKCQAQKRWQANEFARKAHGAYSGHPEEEPGHAEIMKNLDKIPDLRHPWQRLGAGTGQPDPNPVLMRGPKHFPYSSPLIPMLKRENEWQWRAFKANRERAAKYVETPLTRRRFAFINKPKKKKKK